MQESFTPEPYEAGRGNQAEREVSESVIFKRYASSFTIAKKEGCPA
jgi:hypothetical protein